jgi:hypothetical protein
MFETISVRRHIAGIPANRQKPCGSHRCYDCAEADPKKPRMLDFPAGIPFIQARLDVARRRNYDETARFRSPNAASCAARRANETTEGD